MTTQSVAKKAAPGLSLARRTLGGVHGVDSEGFLQQAALNTRVALALRAVQGAGSFDPTAGGPSGRGRLGIAWAAWLRKEAQLLRGRSDSEGGDETPAERMPRVDVITADTPMPRIDGYELQRQIGRGGSATVYLARELKHDRPVALKVLHPALAASLQSERFHREISIVAKLAHPNILPLLDSGTAGTLLYYVTPYVSGESLRQRLDRVGKLSVVDAVRLACEAADALDYAHREHLVHRDVKPENILLADGHALLADFGIARALSLAADDRLTTAGMALGTPRYMSPEQASGAFPLDGRSDVYSLGCVLYELLSGGPPFDGATAHEIVAQHSSAAVPSLRSVSPPIPVNVDRALRSALAKRPQDRHASAAAFAAALGGITAGRSELGARLRAMVGAASRPVQLAGVAGRLLAAALIAYWILGGGKSTARSTATTSSTDTTRLVVFPVAREGEPARPVKDDVLLYEAIAAWKGVSLVDQFRVAGGLARIGGTLAVEQAGALASSLGAGRFILVRATPAGDSSRVYATLYEGEGLTPLHSATSLIPNDPLKATRGFASLAQQLLLREIPSDSVHPTRTGSSQLPAVQAFGFAQLALSRWDLVAADSSLRVSLSFDPQYLRANLWLAQVRAWRGLPVQDWSSLATRAMNGSSQLPLHEQEQASALVNLSSGRFDDACRVYDALRRRNDRDFIAWYGLGQCRSMDRGVLRDMRSPSGWRMRSSYHAATLAYANAFELLPSTYAGYELDDFEGLRSLLRVGNVLIPARAVPPDSGEFLARLALRDTLVLVPYPFSVVRAGGAAAVPPGFSEALSNRIEAFSRVAAGWSAAFPNRSGPKHAVAIALEMQGNRTAIDTLMLARRLSDDGTRRTRLAAREVLVRLRHAEVGNAQEWRAVRALADSQLVSIARSAEVASVLRPLAALTGHCEQSERLSRLRPLRRDGLPVPEHLNAALNLHLSRAALACSPGRTGLSLTALTALVDREMLTLGSREQVWLQAAMLRPVLLSPSVDSTLIAQLVARGDTMPLVLAARALVLRDTAAVRAHLDVAGRVAASSLTTPDMALFAASLALQATDTATTLEWLDKVLGNIGAYDSDVLEDDVTIAALLRCMVMRADVAAQSGDRATARRWGGVVAILWEGADPELQVVVRRMARYATRG